MHRTLGGVVNTSPAGIADKLQPDPIDVEMAEYDLRQLQIQQSEEIVQLIKQCDAELATLQESAKLRLDDDEVNDYMMEVDYARLSYISCLRWLRTVCQHQRQLAQTGHHLTQAKISNGDRCNLFVEKEIRFRRQAAAFGLPVDEYRERYL